jgi:hypothetical protein
MRLPLGASLALLSACIDPLVSDDVERSRLILPQTAVVEDLLQQDPSWRLMISGNDGLPDDTPDVLIYTAFADGETIRYWDFGAVSPTAIPLYLLVEPSETPMFDTPRGGFSPVGHHPPVFDAIPGDLGYSPYWGVVLVPVTDRYDGELLPSFAAVDEAQRVGLVEAPIPIAAAINCPVVLPEARLERADGTFSKPKIAFYRGFIVHYFDFDTVAFDPDGGPIAAPRVYELRRSQGEPISEMTRGVDFTGDGDLADTNHLFLSPPGRADYTGLVTPVDTIVAADLETLDVSGKSSILTSTADLFRADGSPDPEVVVALYPRAVVLNRPIAQPTPAPPTEP